MTVNEALTKRRTIRRFEAKEVPTDILHRAVNAARLAPCGGNFQSLRFVVVKDSELCRKIFDLSAWGMHLKDGSGRPSYEEMPTAWVIVVNDTLVKDSAYQLDVGAACMAIITSAMADGISSCWLEGIKKEEIGNLLNLPNGLKVTSSVALGYAAMESEESPLYMRDIPYFWEGERKMKVPKYSLEEVLIER